MPARNAADRPPASIGVDPIADHVPALLRLLQNAGAPFARDTTDGRSTVPAEPFRNSTLQVHGGRPASTGTARAVGAAHRHAIRPPIVPLGGDTFIASGAPYPCPAAARPLFPPSSPERPCAGAHQTSATSTCGCCSRAPACAPAASALLQTPIPQRCRPRSPSCARRWSRPGRSWRHKGRPMPRRALPPPAPPRRRHRRQLRRRQRARPLHQPTPRWTTLRHSTRW